MSTSPKPAPRRLTVTYYVEPQNLRTITVPVNRANALILGLGGAVLWSLASGLYLGASFVGREAAVAPAAAVAALSTAPQTPAPEGMPNVSAATPAAQGPIVVQAAEPEPTAEAAAAPADADSGDEPDTAGPSEPGSAVAVEPALRGTPETTAAGFGPPAVLADPTAALPKKPDSAPAATVGGGGSSIGNHLAVTDPAFSYKPDERVFDASFKIQNKGKPEARGKTWGVATFESKKSGKRLEIASADGVSYRAKSLTLKALEFPIPDDEPGFVAEVTIHVAEDGAEGELTSTYRLDESGATIR